MKRYKWFMADGNDQYITDQNYFPFGDENEDNDDEDKNDYDGIASNFC